MTTEVDVIRTVFEAQFTGRNTVRSVVQELGVVKQAFSKLEGTMGGSMPAAAGRAAQSMSLFQKSIDANVWARYNENVKSIAKAVADGSISMAAGRAAADNWAIGLSNAAGISQELSNQLLGQTIVLGQAQTEATGLAAALGGMSSGMTIAVASAAALTAGLVAAGAALVALYPVAKEGAGIAQLTLSFEALNRNVLHTPRLLEDMQDAAQGTISKVAAMEGFLTVTAGATERASQRFAQAAPQLMEIAKAANKLNPTLGDTNYMFNSLARGIKRSEVRLLDNLGLNIKVAQANKTYAKEIGKTVVQLTAEDKQMALLNETLRVGANLIAQVGGNTESLTDRFNSLTSAWENFVNSWKMGVAASFLPGAGGPVDFLNEQAERMELVAKLAIAQQQGIDVGYDPSRYSDKNTSLESLRDFNDKLEKEFARRVEIEARYQQSQEFLRSQRKEQGMEDPYLQWLQQQGETFDNPQEKAQKRMDILRRDYERYMRQLNASWEEGQNNVITTEKQKEALKELAGVHKEAAEQIARYWEDIGDIQDKAAKANEAALERYYANIAAGGQSMRDLSGEDSLFTTSLENIGDAWVRTNPMFEDESAVLEKLTKASDKAYNTLQDYELGIKGVGLEQGKLNEKMQEQRDIIAHLAPQIQAITTTTAEYAKVSVQATLDMEKVEDRFRAHAAAAGVGAVGWAGLMAAQGEWTDQQAEAALMQAAVDKVLQQAALDLAAHPEFTAEQSANFWASVEEAIAEIQQKDFSIVLHPELNIVPKVMFGDVMKDAGYDSPAYIPREERDALAAAFFDEAAFAAKGQAVADKTFNEMMAFFNGKSPEESTIDLSVGIGNLDETDAMLNAWMAEKRNVIVNIIPVDPAGILSTAPSTWSGAGVYSTPGKANGGPVQGNSPYLVGERGPEIFVPNTNGTILPNGSGGAGNITINNYNRDAAAITNAYVARINSEQHNALLGRN